MDQDVRVVDCDTCGSTGEIALGQISNLPQGWLAVGRDGREFAVFCSRSCLAHWAAAEQTTSGELTAVARAAFKKQIGG